MDQNPKCNFDETEACQTTVPRQYQKIEAKVQPHHEWPPGELPEQNFAKIHLEQNFITRRALFFRAADLHRESLWVKNS